MNNLNAELLGYPREPIGQRKIVRRILKKRIVQHINPVELDTRVRPKAERALCGDEVDFVAAPGKRCGEFRRNYTGPTLSRVARDGDFHSCFIPGCMLGNNS